MIRTIKEDLRVILYPKHFFEVRQYRLSIIGTKSTEDFHVDSVLWRHAYTRSSVRVNA